MHAEAVLFVDHRETQIAEAHVLGEDRVRADHDVDQPLFERFERHRARSAALASGEDRKLYARGLGHRFQRGQVLARENLRRRHERALAARFDRVEQRHHCDHGLARADVALKQPHHPARRRHVGKDFADRFATAPPSA